MPEADDKSLTGHRQGCCIVVMFIPKRTAITSVCQPPTIKIYLKD